MLQNIENYVGFKTIASKKANNKSKRIAPKNNAYCLRNVPAFLDSTATLLVPIINGKVDLTHASRGQRFKYS